MEQEYFGLLGVVKNSAPREKGKKGEGIIAPGQGGGRGPSTSLGGL